MKIGKVIQFLIDTLLIIIQRTLVCEDRRILKSPEESLKIKTKLVIVGIKVHDSLCKKGRM